MVEAGGGGGSGSEHCRFYTSGTLVNTAVRRNTLRMPRGVKKRREGLQRVLVHFKAL